ncbi:hypothetical protein NC653_028961 [Populus alba x Populus x berolinensis]|uniref:Uncharacterized protein n=1 Tax=Populus alba x Populus x berolinensis TaxID=444605 RepID=A0AAD6Q2T4_9ROSI|nr:hypothetical protein NC653_028961 [Populus alba x Populus x berolinensis]
MARRGEQSMTFLIAMRTGPSRLSSPQKQRRKCFIEKHFDLQGSSFSVGDQSCAEKHFLFHILCRKSSRSKLIIFKSQKQPRKAEYASAYKANLVFKDLTTEL